MYIVLDLLRLYLLSLSEGKIIRYRLDSYREGLIATGLILAKSSEDGIAGSYVA